jgi:hypothetical protein
VAFSRKECSAAPNETVEAVCSHLVEIQEVKNLTSRLVMQDNNPCSNEDLLSKHNFQSSFILLHGMIFSLRSCTVAFRIGPLWQGSSISSSQLTDDRSPLRRSGPHRIRTRPRSRHAKCTSTSTSRQDAIERPTKHLQHIAPP